MLLRWYYGLFHQHKKYPKSWAWKRAYYHKVVPQTCTFKYFGSNTTLHQMSVSRRKIILFKFKCTTKCSGIYLSWFLCINTRNHWWTIPKPWLPLNCDVRLVWYFIYSQLTFMAWVESPEILVHLTVQIAGYSTKTNHTIPSTLCTQEGRHQLMKFTHLASLSQ